MGLVSVSVSCAGDGWIQEGELFSLIVLSYSEVLVFYFILYYFLVLCLFTNGRKKGGESRCDGSWGGARMNRGDEYHKHNQNAETIIITISIYYMRKF